MLLLMSYAVNYGKQKMNGIKLLLMPIKPLKIMAVHMLRLMHYVVKYGKQKMNGIKLLLMPIKPLKMIQTINMFVRYIMI